MGLSSSAHPRFILDFQCDIEGVFLCTVAYAEYSLKILITLGVRAVYDICHWVADHTSRPVAQISIHRNSLYWHGDGYRAVVGSAIPGYNEEEKTESENDQHDSV